VVLVAVVVVVVVAAVVAVAANNRTSLRRRMACETAKNITELLIADIRRKVNELNRLDRELSALLAQCRGAEIP
jgi:hypothetical protein